MCLPEGQCDWQSCGEGWGTQVGHTGGGPIFVHTVSGLHKFCSGVLALCLSPVLLMTQGGGGGELSGRGTQQFQPLSEVSHSFIASAQFLLVLSTYFTLILFKE